MFRSVWAAVCLCAAAASSLILMLHRIPAPVQTPQEENVHLSAPRPESSSAPSVLPPSVLVSKAPEQSEAPLTGYWMREMDGKIAIYRNGSDVPMRILDCPFSLLPEADRKALREGIFVTDDRALAQLIEDFTS